MKFPFHRKRINERVPLLTFSGGLRRVDPENQEQLAATVLGAAFPRFGGLSETITGIPNHARPNRRYAGGSDLPRGRYFALTGSDGGDGGTIANELCAYCDLGGTGQVEIDDVAFPTWLSSVNDETFRSLYVREQSPTKDRYVVIFFHRRPTPLSLEELADQSDSYLMRLIRSEREKKGRFQEFILGACHSAIFPLSDGSQLEVNGVFVYYETLDTSIERVLDLRTKDAQDWLVELVSSDVLNLGMKLEHGFFSLLPFLIGEQLRGDIVTDRIGRYLRAIGAGGLVFPSARCDCRLLIRDGVLEDHAHWNLVDYRDSPTIALGSFDSAFVAQDLLRNIGWFSSTEKALAGSFIVQGNVSAHFLQRMSAQDSGTRWLSLFCSLDSEAQPISPPDAPQAARR